VLPHMKINDDIGKAKSLRMDASDEWVVERRAVDIQIEEMGEEIRPDILVCASATAQIVIGVTVISPDALDSEVASWALGCMLSPMAGKPHRPGKIVLTGDRLGQLQPILEQLAIPVSTDPISHPFVDEVMSDLERSLTGGALPPYMSASMSDPALVAEFFQVAADFFKLQPWKMFEYEIPVRVELRLKKPVTYWAVVLGVEGQELGLGMYRSVDDLISVFDAEDQVDAVRVAESTWSIAFSYQDFDDVGLTAKAECLDNEWVLPEPHVYPSAIVLDPKGKELARRPTAKELTDLVAVTRGLTEFLRIHRKQVRNEEVIAEDSRQVMVLAKLVDVIIMFPAPEFIE
jgi:hypothetical protein